jgi:hypothetical protein
MTRRAPKAKSPAPKPSRMQSRRRGDAMKEITIEVIQITLEKAGVIFVGADGGGPGVRLRS